MPQDILLELELLKKKMDAQNGIDTPFSQVLYAITNKLKRSDLFYMTNAEIKKHIQKVQLIES